MDAKGIFGRPDHQCRSQYCTDLAQKLMYLSQNAISTYQKATYTASFICVCVCWFDFQNYSSYNHDNHDSETVSELHVLSFYRYGPAKFVFVCPTFGGCNTSCAFHLTSCSLAHVQQWTFFCSSNHASEITVHRLQFWLNSNRLSPSALKFQSKWPRACLARLIDPQQREQSWGRVSCFLSRRS